MFSGALTPSVVFRPGIFAGRRIVSFNAICYNFGQSASSIAMNDLKHLVLIFGSAWTLSVSALITESSPVVTRGVWNSNFDAVLAFARSSHVPMVLYHGRTSCPHCVNLKSALGQDDFTAWQGQRRFAMCLNLDKTSNAKSFSSTGVAFPSGEAQTLSTVPRMSVYWLKPSGEEVHVSFRAGSAATMPVAGVNLEMSVADSVDAILAAAGYVDETPTAFLYGDTEGDRMEASPTTEYVDVAIVRTPDKAAAAERLEAVYPDELKLPSATFAVDWAAGETERRIRVATPPAPDGARIRLTLFDRDGQTVAVSHITYANPPCGAANPLWIGERTADTLQPGEWTVDFDLAASVAAKSPDNAFTLVFVEGSRWDANSALTAAHVADREDFSAWARAHNVYLVAVDLPPSPAKGGASLLSGASAPADAAFVRTTTPPQPLIQSGVGYLTRKMADSNTVMAVEARFADLAANLLHRPEDDATDRPTLPAFVLLDKQGNVRGRIGLFAKSAPTAPDAGYLFRFDELLATADDPHEEQNAHVLSSDHEISCAEAFAGTLSGADLCDVVRLAGVAPGSTLAAIAVCEGGDPDRICELALIEVREKTATVVQSVTGRLGDGLALETPILAASAAWHLRIRSTDVAADSRTFAVPSDTTVGYRVTFAVRPNLLPDTPVSGSVAPSAATVPLFTGLDLKATPVLAGILTVSVGRTGKISAKFTGTEKKAISFSGTWQATGDDGRLYAHLVAKTGERLLLSASSAGVFSAQLADAANGLASEGPDVLLVGSSVAASGDLSAFAGIYNVTFENASADAQLAGHAFLQLKFVSQSALKKRQASVAGVLPDGKPLSCKASVSRISDELAAVTLFRRTSTGVFSAVFSLQKPEVPHAIDGLDAVPSAFMPTAKGQDPGVLTFRVRGSALPPDLKPAALCEKFSFGPDLTVVADKDSVVTVTANEKKFVTLSGEKVSWQAKTGVFGGKVNVTQSTGRLTGATYKCMLVPGWAAGDGACPGLGTLYYKDKVNGVSVTRSRPVFLSTAN